MKEFTIVAFGDSLTFGYGVDEDVTFVSRLQKALPKVFPQFAFSIYNKGINGDTTREGVERLEKDVLQYRPQLVLFLFGSNDSCLLEGQYRTPYEFEKNVRTMLQAFGEIKAKTLLITPPPLIDTDEFPFNTTDRVYQYSTILKTIGTQTNTTVFDFFTTLSSMKENFDQYFQWDGVHLSEMGYDMLFHGILEKTATILEDVILDGY